ncbi:MAG: hypothetical protein A3A16_00770 [Candidatus Harrisonbacteria bacterium RIFCSPLOWO2_01_FULL_44_18]|uniref:Serine protease n=1 Tax=Candidatus Harrisonbacteria bacterium RIFCSPLOWO2_01_FULL_44_18 TaxID=1798407 RepID=A0A1G1ZL84_9BACT|nr:MAG: hypothetical protein A3A16_00770 [Candidatus Harrisonbacteria bacterium RIFCSPLOWO2_01_FULL_44_18]
MPYYRRRRYGSASKLAYHFQTFSVLAAGLALSYILLFVVPQKIESPRKSALSQRSQRVREANKEQEALDLVYTRLLLRQILTEADYLVGIKIEHLTELRDGCAGSIIERNGAYFVLTVAHIRNGICCPMDCVYVYPQDSANREEVELIGYDSRLDVAILKFKNPLFRFDGRVARLGSSTLINEGEPVILLRAPLGDRDNLGLGEIKSNDFDDFYSPGDLVPRLVYTCPSAPGDSGSPVLNLDGEIIGMHIGCNPLDGKTKLAIPANSIAAVLDELIRGIKR